MNSGIESRGYRDPITLSYPRVPVVANSGRVYEFVAIARSLLLRNKDPIDNSIIDTLTYCRTIKELNLDLGIDDDGYMLPLSHDEKIQIAVSYLQLKSYCPSFRVNGILELEGIKKMIDERKSYVSSNNINTLIEAVYFRDLSVVKFFLNLGISPDQTNSNGSSLLYIAVCRGYLDMVMLLLKYNVNVDMVCNNGSTPLIKAVQDGNLDLLKVLLDAGASAEKALWNGYKALDIAIVSGHLIIVKLLLKLVKSDKDNSKNLGHYLFLAAQNGHVDIVRFFIDLGANVHFCNQNGQTPFLESIKKGHVDVVKFLLSIGYSPYKLSTTNRTALDYAVRYEQLNVVKLLLSVGVSPNRMSQRDYVFLYGSEPKDASLPLFSAAENGNLRVLETLLYAGAIPDQSLQYGETPLFIAAKRGHLSIVKSLLNVGANPNKATLDGSTPLYTAAMFGYLDIVINLLEQGNMIFTPIDLSLLSAARQGKKEFAHVLLSNKYILGYYLNQIICNPDLIRDVFAKNQFFFFELVASRNLIWERLQSATLLNISAEEHANLLKRILLSREESNADLRHPLYTLFAMPYDVQPSCFFMTNIFSFNRVRNITIDIIQEYYDLNYAEVDHDNESAIEIESYIYY